MQAQAKLEEMKLHAHPDLWCLLTVRPGKEQDARDAFRRYGIRCYWPNYVQMTESHRLRKRHYRSLMPGYMFVPSPATATIWDVIERSIGVINAVLNFSGEVATLKNADIEVIREIERGMNTPMPGKSLHNFKSGDKVRFKDDTFGRLPPGRVASSIGDGRISVEVEVMGRLVPIQLFPHQIERVG